jgi:UDP-N-acetylbacillosamine N-acetyltransferase
VNVIVYGAGGHGRVVADVAGSAGARVVAFVDDGPGMAGTDVCGVPVLAWDHLLMQAERRGRTTLALGVGDNHARAAILDKASAAGFPVTTLVHASAIVAGSATLGAGTVVMAAAVVNPGARTERGCIINTGAIVEHDARIAAFALIGPNVALGGGVHVGERSVIGVGASVRPGVRIGAGVTVGVGAAVVEDVADGVVVAGVPARPLPSRRSAEAGR